MFIYIYISIYIYIHIKKQRTHMKTLMFYSTIETTCRSQAHIISPTPSPPPIPYLATPYHQQLTLRPINKSSAKFLLIDDTDDYSGGNSWAPGKLMGSTWLSAGSWEAPGKFMESSTQRACAQTDKQCEDKKHPPCRLTVRPTC